MDHCLEFSLEFTSQTGVFSHESDSLKSLPGSCFPLALCLDLGQLLVQSSDASLAGLAKLSRLGPGTPSFTSGYPKYMLPIVQGANPPVFELQPRAVSM